MDRLPSRSVQTSRMIQYDDTEPGFKDIASELRTLTSALDREALVKLLVRVVELNPESYEDAATHARLLAGQTGKAATAHGPNLAESLDSHPYAKRMRSIMRGVRSLRRRDYDNEYWDDEDSEIDRVIGEASKLIGEAAVLVGTGDARNAAIILRVVSDEWLNGWTSLEDYGESGEEFFRELDTLWVQILLQGEWTIQERSAWRELFDGWRAETEENGIREAFHKAALAADQGWDYPSLCRAMQEAANGSDEFKHDPLIGLRLDILEQSGRLQECCNLALAAARPLHYARMLARLGRIGEAVECANSHFVSAHEAYALAVTLKQQGYDYEALRSGALALVLQHLEPEQAKWIRDLASGNGDTELAIRAALAALGISPSLDDYLALQKLAEGRWTEIYEDAMRQVRSASRDWNYGRIDILLHEKTYDEAIEEADANPWSYTLVERIVDGILHARPDAAIRLSRRQAEPIMDDGKSRLYHHAARWLAKARDAYRLANREGDWRQYKADLLRTHARKYSLRPLIEEL